MSRIPLILLPGLLCDGTVWRDQQKALQGHADTTVANYGELSSITDMARHVLAEVAAPTFSVAGHSMGGRVALEIVRLAPERVDRLALFDTGYQALSEGEPGQAERRERERLLAIAKHQGMRALGLAWAPGMVHPDRVGSPMFEEILHMIERKTPDIFAAQIAALLGRPDASPLLPHIRCPTLILCGRQDTWSPLSRHEQMQQHIPGATLVAIENSGHMSTMEQAQEVTASMLTWLTTIRSA